MATYVIGDVQGCFDELRSLLDAIPFKSDRDRLWFVGDLINRGPKSLETLRFVRELGDQADTVLGNHDLHLLAIYYGGHRMLKADTFEDVLGARDCETLTDWLRHLPLLVETSEDVMTHAGIPHVWNLGTTRRLAVEVEQAIRGSAYVNFFERMYGNEPASWHDTVTGMDRLRVITNYLTRMRFVRADGTMEFKHNGPAREAPEGFRPWFEYDTQVDKELTIYFGHWASLDGRTGMKSILATDSGCVWGRGLTAIRLSDRRRFVWIENQLVQQK